MTDLERRLKRAKDATADAGASSEHSETDLERRLRIAHEEKKQYTRSGEYRRNALQNRTESFMDIVTQGETESRAGIDRYKANRDADYYQQMNKAGVTFRDQDMINRSVTGYKGAYDLWKSAFDREKDAAADRTRREREMTENPEKAPTVSDIVSRYSGKTKTLADLGNNVRGAVDDYKRQSDAAKAAPTPEEARQQAEESVQYWQNVAREAARYGDVYRQATARKHLADSVENYSRATKGYFDNLKNTDPGTYYALTMTPEEIDRELELLNNGAYLDSKITNSLTNDERIMGEYWHRTPQEQRQYEHNLERARFAGETDDERNAYISSEKEAYRDARNRMLNDASVEGSVGSNQEPYNRREEITQANEARKSVLENARLTQKVIQAERDGITNDPQIIASGKQKFEKDQDAIWDRWTVEQGWAETSPKMDNLGRAHEHGYVLDRMDEMTEEQRARIYSLYDRDPQTALKLAQTYAKALDDKVYQEIFDWVAKDSGWQFGRRAVGNLAGAVMNLASGLDPFGYGGQSAGKIGDALIGGAAQSATRNGWFGIEELGGDQSWIDSSVPFVGRGRAGEASQLVSSMEQSALTTLPAMIAGRYDAAAASWLETAGLLLQSSSAARSDYRESIEAGLDDTTAKIHAVAAGIAEYTFEKVSFDKLLAQNTSRMTFKKVMKDVLVQAGIEGSEELHTTLANTIMDEIISGDGKSKIDRRIAELVQGGMSMKEAKGVAEKEWLTGIVNDFIGGAASGGIMTGAHYAVGATVNTAENKIANNAVNQLVGQYAGAQTENFTDADTIEAAKNYAEARGIDASGLTEAAAQARNASVDEAMSALRGSTQSESETTPISKRDSRKAGKAWAEIRTKISQDFDGKSGAQAAQLYDQMAEQYGAGIKTIVDEVVTTQARQSYLEQSQTAQELQQKVKPQVEALPEGGYKQASMRAYDQAEYQLRQQEAAKTADRLAKAGNIDTEVTYTNKDGSETTAQIADLSDDLTSVVLDNGETVPIKDVQMSADTASAIRIFSRIAGKKAASLAFREYRAYLNNGGTEGYRFAEAVATAYGQGLNGVLTPEQALKMAPDFAQEAAQRAFNAGRQKHQANIENEQARRKAAEEKAKAEGAQTVKGELRGVDSIKWEKMNATRRTRAQNQIKYLESIAQGIGVDIELFQSEATRRGKRMAYRGEQGAWYVDKATGKPVIRIDVNAGANFISDLNAALIATTGHELAHHFQHISPAVYDEYRQAVVQAILSTENGYEKLQRLIEHEKRINRRADGTTISTDEAIDEVVADASRDRVGDRNLWKNVADSMSDESRGKVAQWLHDRFSKILKLTKRYAGFEAADLVLQSAQEYQDLIGELWQKLATQAANAVDVRSSDYPTDPDAASNNPSSTAFAMRFNPQITEGSMNFRKRHPALSKHISNEVLQAANESVEKMVSIMLPYLDGPQVTNGKKYLPDEVLGTTTFKDSSYGGKSIENTTICWRTLAYIEFTDEIKKKIGRPLTVQESFLASQMLYDIAKEPQCLYCYVSLDRKAYDGFLLDYLKQRDSVIESYAKLSQAERDEITKQTRNPNPGKKNKTAQDAAEKRFAAIPLYKEFLGTRANTGPMRARFAQWIDIANSGSKLVSSEDLATAERRGMLANGMSWADGSKLAKQTVSLADQVNDAAQYAQSASWAKKMEEYRAYNGDILKMSAKTVAKLNGEYGLRFYSFSEYTPAFIVENMQQIRDASLKGLRGLAYTKKTDFARIFWQTGMNINISVFGRWGTDASGKRTVLMDKDQGADWNEVKALRDHENVGAVFVATDDEMVNWALAQDWIDVVIPFHTVRTGADVAAFYDWVVHNKEQADINEKGNNKTVTAAEHGNDRDTFLQICKERGLTPRFSKWLYNPNYMKLVNETRQPVSTSMPMSPIYDTEAAENSFRSFIEDGGYYGDYYKPVDVQQAEGKTGLTKDEAIDRVVNDIREGRNAKQVDYGRQDYELVEDEFGRIRVNNRTHGQNIQRNAARSVEETDAEYMDAVKRGDMETAQRMVDEAARKAGYTNRAYHGTSAEFTAFSKGKIGSVFHKDKDGFFFTTDQNGAKYYASASTWAVRNGKAKVMDVVLKTKNPLIVESRIVSPVKYFDTHTEALIQKAKKGKRGVPYDSIIVTNDATSNYKFGDPDTERLYVVFEPEQIKSADPITYDDQGNVIPLSERFNEANEDIRYSSRPTTDSTGRELSEGQQEYFKGSKIRDKYGNLLTLYHGTASDFTVFDLGRSGKNYDGWSEYGIGIYLTPDKKFATYFSESASQRGGTPKLMELYANIKNPFNVNDPVTVDVSEYAKKYKLTEDDVKFLKKSGDRWLAFMREHNEDIYDFLTSHGYDGLWDAYGTHAPTQIVAFTENQVKNVDNKTPTKNLDIRYSQRDNAKPRSAQTQRDAGYKLSESKFYSLYSAHKLNMTGKGNVQDQIASIMADGFKGDGGFGNNVMPTNISYDVDENGKRIPRGLSAQKYAPKKGEYILLVPKEGVEVKGGRYNFTERVKPGYKPAFDYEIVRADYDGQPYYEMYERAYDKSQAGKADVTLDGAQFSQRDAAAISDMEIIESLDASEYTTPEIRNLVNEMKRKVETIRDYEDRLGKVRSEIDALDRETPATEKQKKKHDARLERLNGLAANLERKINEHTDILARKYRRIEGVRNVIDQARKKAIQKTRERKDAQFARSQEKRNERDLRERIQRHASDLEQKLLKPSDKRHIPEQYRLATTALLNAINRESGYDYDPDTLHTTSRGATVGKRVEKGAGTATKRTQAFLALKEALKKIAAEDGFTGELLDFDGDGSGLISQALALGDVPISRMNMEQLGTIWQTVRALEHNITNFNRAFAAGRTETISGIADKFRTDTEGRKPRQRDAKNALDAKQMKLFAMTKYLENPYTFFDHYGESGHEMFRRLRDAQDLIQVRGDEIAEIWLGEMRNALGVTGTDEKVRKAVEDFVEKTDKAVEVFTLQSGQKLTLTHSMMMDIWLLSQRAPTGLNHLLGSGVIQPKIDVKGHYTTRDATFRHLTIEDIQEIGSRLTEQEKATARAMQVVQRQLAKWGNEASMTVYGYRKFTEDNYWPVKNAREENKSESGQDNGRQATGTMNKGMARNLKPNAATGTEPVSAFRQLQGSISDMLTYSTWGPTLEDMNRVFNYKYKDESGATVTTVKSLVDQYGGEGSQRYWADLAKHISVGIGSSDNAIAAAIGKGVGAVKGARVAFNARVVVQQPTAYSRAAEVIDHKYLIASLGDLKSWSPGAKSAWNRALKYSPTARRKDSTTYDMGGSIRNDKALGLEKASAVEKFTDVGTALAGKADALTWGRLWHAAELQISAKTDLEKGSDEYYDAVNKLFTEAVDRTQVMDGILQRPAIMRMNSDFVKGMTAYMGEPLMQVNMLMRQAASWKQVGWKVAKKAMFRTASGLLLSQLINAMVQSVFDATFRRTDEDKDWWERFLAEMSGIDGTEKSAFDRITGVLLGGNLVSETTYLNKIPGINDMLSLIEGYDPGNDRFDLAAAKDLINAVKLLSNDKYTGWHKAKELVSKMTMLFGVGVGNALRDIYGAAHNSVFDFAGPRAKFDFKAIWLNPESKQNKRQYFDLLWQMLETGDKKGFKAYAERLSGGGGDALMKFVSGEAQDRYENGTIDAETFSDMMEAAGADGEYIEGRFYNSIRELHEKKLATDEEAYELLQKWAGKDSKEAWDIVRKWNAKEAFSGDPDDFKWSQYDDLYAAIAEDGDILGVVREYKEKGYTDKQVNDNTKDGIRAALTGGSITENEAIDLLTRYVTYTKDGQAVAFDKDKAWKTVQEWQAKAENDGDPDYSYNQYDELFSAIDANKDVNGIVSELTAHGYDKDDVTKAVKGHLIDNYVAGKASETALKNQLSRYCGIVKTDEVSEIVNSANCKKTTGYYPDSLKDGYVDGKLSKDNVISALKVYKGLDSTSASNRVRAWDFQKEHPDLKWDSDRVDAYYDKRPEGGGKSAYEAGISVETYDDYRNRAAKAKGVDANGDGKTDSGSKKAEILRIIDSLDLSRSQKDALYYINGWAASTIYEAPWH